MKDLTVAEASEIVNLTPQALYKQIKAGKLNRTPEKKIQFAELLRVFPDKVNDYKQYIEVSIDDSTDDNQVAKIEIKYLKEKIDILEKSIVERDLTISTLNERVDKLISMNEALQIKALPSPETVKKGWFFNRK